MSVYLNTKVQGEGSMTVQAPDSAPIGEGWVPTYRLSCDPHYQRDVNLRQVKNIAANWDEFKAGSLLVSQRANGDLIVIDGQHRYLAARQLGITKMRAVVRRFATMPAEALYFTEVNTDRRGLSPLDKWKAELAAGIERSLTIERLVSERGGQINHQGDTIAAVKSLWTIYDKHGEMHLAAVLDILMTALGALNGDTCQGRYLAAVSEFLRLHSDKETERMVVKLREVGTKKLNAMSNMYRASGASGFRASYLALVEIHNHAAKANRIAAGQSTR